MGSDNTSAGRDTGPPSAGRSAAAEYERRREQARVTCRAGWPRLVAKAAVGAAAAGGGIAILAAAAGRVVEIPGWAGVGSGLTHELQAAGALSVAVWILARGVHPGPDITAWRAGADGEETAAAALAPLLDEGWAVLHDRRLPGPPGSRANIDHIIVGPGGIWMIETKAWRGELSVGAHHLRLNGRSVTTVYDQCWRQAHAITATLHRAGDDPPTPVRPVLCVVGTTLRRERDGAGRATLGPVEVHTPDTLLRRLRLTPRVLDASDVVRLANVLDGGLAPAG